MLTGTKSLNDNSYVSSGQTASYIHFPEPYSYSSNPCIGSIASAHLQGIQARGFQNSPYLICTTNQMAYTQPQIAKAIGNQYMKGVTQRKD
jgi:hypothetical protein